MPKYTVTRSYNTVEVFQVEADNEQQAFEKSVGGIPIRTYDGDYNDSVEIEEGWEHDNA